MPGDVHGVLHKLSPAELADLMCMEHEYLPEVVLVEPYECNSTQQLQAPQSPQPQQTPQQPPQPQQPQQQTQQQTQTLEPQQQQQLVPAIAFQTPTQRLIRDGLPPTRR